MDGVPSAMALPAAIPAVVPVSGSGHRPHYALDRDRTILHHGSFAVSLQAPVQNPVHISASASASAAEADADADADDAAPGGAVIKRRAPIACRRCRRMRSKCVHEKAVPPCKACLEAGLGPAECVFPVRGQPDNDREFRHPRMRADKASRRDPAKVRRDILDTPVMRPVRIIEGRSSIIATEWDRLPPLSGIIDGVNRFTHHYFQLGFIPKEQFPQRLQADHQSVSVFLVVSILAVSARLTPVLAQLYGSGLKAADYFMERAAQLAYGEIYQEPTLERCQAFYLLSIAQQGNGLRNNSYINMGISMRMAALMRLHREETYQIQNPSPETIIQAESARRTLWMLHSQDQLHSSPYSPVSLAASDITALLPCEERDFALGRQPVSRAALEGTPPAIENPALTTVNGRSLFASLIQSHHFWGMVSRRAVNFARSAHPWDPNSEYAIVIKKLRLWEEGLPLEHQWNHYVLQEYKASNQDLAYLGVTMIPRLCNVVCRRPYLIDFIIIGYKDEQKRAFFSKLSLELFHNVRRLFDQIDAQFTGRTPDESVGAQMAAFCVYCCGLFSIYLCRYPNICPDPVISRDGPMMLHRTLSILKECKEVWPLADRWVDSLERFTQDPSGSLAAEDGMADGKDPIPNPVAATTVITTAITGTTSSDHSPSSYARTRGSMDASQSTSTLQSPSSTDLATSPLTVPTNQGIPHLPSRQQQQQQQQQLQQQVVLHRQQQPQQQGTPIPVPLPIPDSQSYPPQLSAQMYMNTDPSNPSNPSNSNALGMFMGAYDPSQNDSALVAAATAAAQGFSLPNGDPTMAAAPANPMFYASSDGFEAELQFYVNGSQDWVPPSGVFDGYS